ncbi:MAG: hypothetical protein IT195_01250 [Microthrixaceae bacterium]|nr:hypothetical protein [Microthrixaceae bacterium]
MRNHNEKARDMARSVLPSTARKGARDARAVIHGRERAHERRLLHELGRTARRTQHRPLVRDAG